MTHSASYVPAADGQEWAGLSPEQAGFDPAKLAAAVDFAKAGETAFVTVAAGAVSAYVVHRLFLVSC